MNKVAATETTEQFRARCLDYNVCPECGGELFYLDVFRDELDQKCSDCGKIFE